MNPIAQDESPELLFITEFASVVGQSRVGMSSEVIMYVGSLLASAVRRATDEPNTCLLDRHIAASLLRGESAEGPERITLLRHAGDTALLLSGYWWRFLDTRAQRRGASRGYHQVAGSVAYRLIGWTVQERTVAETYQELADKFVDIASALARVSNRFQRLTNEDLIRVYGTYLETRNKQLRELLHSYSLPLGDTHEH